MKFSNTIKELRSFLLLWGSQTISELGTAMTDYALIIWVHKQIGSASSLTFMTLCSFMPTILFRFIGGAFVDRHNKKKIMLITDLIDACGTLTILILYCTSLLRVWNIYLITVLLSFANAFQVPASFVAAGLMVPKEHYTRISGFQSFSGSAIMILSPALGSVILAYLGIGAVLLIDLMSFGSAFLVLMCFIKIPEAEKQSTDKKESLIKSCREGITYLRKDSMLFRLTLFLAVMNFFAKLGNDGMLAPFVLTRTGGDQRVLGIVQAANALGVLAGSIIVIFLKPAKNKIKVIFLTCAMAFSGNIAEGLSEHPYIWCIAEFYSYIFAVIMNAELTAFMREKIPMEVQGRVWSVKDTLQNCAIPLGLFLGGIMADHVFAPLMSRKDVPAILLILFGNTEGSGIAFMVFLAGCAGIVLCLIQLLKSGVKHP